MIIKLLKYAEYHQLVISEMYMYTRCRKPFHGKSYTSNAVILSSFALKFIVHILIIIIASTNCLFFYFSRHVLFVTDVKIFYRARITVFFTIVINWYKKWVQFVKNIIINRKNDENFHTIHL